MAMWKGTISFGLVAVPIQILPALRSHRSAFHMLHAKDNSPVQRRMICPAENVFVHPEHQQRGYPVGDDKYVVVEDEEVKQLEPKRSETIEIESFVDLDEVDPVYFDRPYYILPTGPAKPYRLLVEALGESNRAGIAKFVMHAREHLVALRAVGDALCLQMLRFADEIRPGDDVAPDEGKLAKKDIDAMTREMKKLYGDFEPGMIEDRYQKRIDKLIKKLRKTEGTVSPPGSATEEAPQVEHQPARDLIAVLEESLAEARGEDE
ncbi:MAG: Ku protein [Phycisphaerae bacterium]